VVRTGPARCGPGSLLTAPTWTLATWSWPQILCSLAGIVGARTMEVDRLHGETLGAPIKLEDGETPPHGFAPKRGTITAQGFREWLG